MFPNAMNDESFYNKGFTREEWSQSLSQDDRHRSGIRFARRIRLPRTIGLAGIFFPLAGALVTQSVDGGWWLLLVIWGFVWPHFAWQLAYRSADPHGREVHNLKADAVIAGLWVGLTGVNVPLAAALIMMISINMIGAGGLRLFSAGMTMAFVATLLTLKLTGISPSFAITPLELWMTLPVMMLYPMLFAWVSYQTAIKLAEHKRRLQVMSTRDGMTGVFNRRHWETLLRNEYENCRRNHRVATVLLIDIDHFKSINDTYGHDVGDEAIVAITRQLQMTLRGCDLIGRFGGDEFAVIMCGTPAENAIAAVSRVHEHLETLHLPCAPQVRLHISVGVAPFRPHIGHYREWLKAADVALYKAKNAGRNRTEVAA